MTTGTGLAAQIGMAIEGTPGTRQVPVRFFPFVSESMKLNQTRLASRGLRAGRRTKHQSDIAASFVDGNIEFEMAPQGLGVPLRAMMGTLVTTGVGPYTHTGTPGPLADDLLTVQVGRPFVGSTTVQPFDYIGCMVANWSIGFSIEDYATLSLGLSGVHEDTAQSLAAFTPPATWRPFVFTAGVLSIAGSEQVIKSGSVSGDNAIDAPRHRMRSATPARPLTPAEGGMRSYTGQVECDFTSLVAYNRFVAGTEAALSLVFTQGAHTLTVAGNVVFTGETPNVSGPEALNQALPFEFLSTTSDAAALTITLVNGDATP
jgi:hypothetical protein